MTENIKSDENRLFSDEAVTKLSSGIFNLYTPSLKAAKNQLLELTRKQEVVCRQMHDQNLQLSALQCNPDLLDMIKKVKLCRQKLNNIKNKMTSLHEKASKLKKRGLKLEQNKQYEAKQRAQQREREEQLIGKQST